MNIREIIAKRAALELNDGEVANLGFGMPTQAVNYLPEGVSLIMHTENGAFGIGPKPKYEEANSDVSNAGSEPVTLPPGAAIMSLGTSLGAMRNGYIDVTILGALEVDQKGNIANWAVKRKGLWWPGIGGAMDLTHGTKKIVVTLTHTDKYGNSKIKKEVNLPKTGINCVKTIITEKAVFDVGDDILILREIAPGLTIEEIKEITEADFIVSEDFKEMEI
ncbi:3-oxoacid CoA-transferase subunit B [Maledivibacter halophilus]|uniref:3-oxoacid CoA-transferase subunit B n=1 Tax=Maledivibacter halophilus TaxID=36842 RepID=A0A1T5MDM4_9FIRM|nr:3-oxoacid CoA-transferase subunit B [Maledivibacter halophilus]SKC86193.1 3-oxoacid CoA-transferase subunit B [Maledivibacter halophilus]